MTSETGPAVERDVRHVAFISVTVAFLIFIYLFSPFTQVFLGWFVDFEDNISHRVHEVTFGALFTIIFVGLLIQLRASTRNFAGLVQATVAALTLAVVITLSTGWEWPTLIYLVPLAVVVWLHPGRESFFRYKLNANRAMLVMMLLITGSLLLGFVKEFDKAINEVRLHISHWGGMAAFALTLLIIGYLAALRVHGWPILAWTTGASVLVYGVLSMSFRFDASARPDVTAVFSIIWGLLFIFYARRARPVPALSRSAPNGAQPHTEQLLIVERAGPRRALLAGTGVAVVVAIVGGSFSVSVPFGVLAFALIDILVVSRIRLLMRRRRATRDRPLSSPRAAVAGTAAAIGLLTLGFMGSLAARSVIAPPVPHTIESTSQISCLECHSTGTEHAPTIDWRTHNEEFPRSFAPFCGDCHSLPKVTPANPAAGQSSIDVLIEHPEVHAALFVSELGVSQSMVSDVAALVAAISRQCELPMTSLATRPTLASEGSLDGPALWAMRAAWAAVVLASLAVAAFEAFVGGDRPIIDTQGPLSLQPELARQLEFRLFDRGVLQATQTTVHLLGMTLFSATAVLIFVRRSRDWVVALSSTTLLLMGVALFVPSKLLAETRPDWDVVVGILGVFDAGPQFWRSAAGVAALLFALLFPDGRFVPTWTKWLAAAFVVEIILWTALPGVGVFDVSRWPDYLVPVWTLGLAVVAVYAQIHRYVRVSGSETRKQTRLVMVSLTAIVGSFLLIWVLDPGLSRSVDFGLVLVTERTQAIYDLNILSMLTVGVVLFPISIGVSVARYRLWDTDLLINRALVYGSMTGIIGLVLLGAAVLVGGAVENTFGRGIGIGLSGLLMAVVFQPLRARVQTGIDRRFYPQKYDAERALDALAESIRDEVDLEVLRELVVATIAATLEPGVTHLSLPALDESYGVDHHFLADLYLTEANLPIEAVSQLLPSEATAAFALRAIVVVVPLVSHGELAGVLELGAKRDGADYSALDQQLLRRLANQTAPVIRYGEIVAREATQRAARQAYEQELQLAQQIQRDLLPRSLPELDGWELGARYEPSRQVGGDLYDFINLPDGRLGIVIADVTDKGVAAGMVMATCRSVLRAAATASENPSPGEVLARVNMLLLPDIPEKMFVTCFYAVLDPSIGHLIFANAGQNLPMLRSGDRVTELMARGMPLGLMADMTYEESEVAVSAGESLLFYSDGLVEAHAPNGEMFGKARVIDRVRNHPGGADLLGYLVESLIGFAGVEGAKDDDVTLVAIKRLEPLQTLTTDMAVLTEFSVPSEQGGELVALERLDAVIEALELPSRTAERLRTAVAEATMNAMEHGNGYDPNLNVDVRVLASPTKVEVHVTDQGHGAPITSVEEPDLDAKLAGEQSPRGWGIFLIKNMVDDLRATQIDGKNRLELVVDRETEH